jgi:hypothetical protein
MLFGWGVTIVLVAIIFMEKTAFSLRWEEVRSEDLFPIPILSTKLIRRFSIESSNASLSQGHLHFVEYGVLPKLIKI